MDHTRSTLLRRLCDRSDEQAWRTFDELYRGMLVGYARARGLGQADAEDVAQQCAQVVLEQIGEYQHAGSFKKWLRAIAEHKIVDSFRRQRREVQPGTGVMGGHADGTPGVEEVWEQHWEVAHLRYCAQTVRCEVAPGTFEAFVGYALEGRDAAMVAAALGMTANQVYVAKHRVLDRIRAKMLELTGEDSIGVPGKGSA